LKITSDTSATTSGGISVDIANAVFSSADVLNVELSKSSALLAAGSITAAGVETVNFNVADAASAGSAAVIHTAALVATSATSVVVTGNNGFNLTNTGNTAITNFDASGVVANSTATAVDTEANLKVTFLSANTTGPTTIKGGAGGDSLTAVAGTDSIDGGAGNDSIDGGAGNDILIGGAGSDLITGGLGVDTLTGGTGVDTFVVVAQATTGVDSITDFVGGVDVLKTGITPTTAALTNLSASAYAGSSLAAQAGLAITAAITAAATNYDSAGDAVLFTYGTDTYVVVNDAGNSTFTDGTDLVVKLTGLSGTLVIGNIIA
jgi:S-layer protein